MTKFRTVGPTVLAVDLEMAKANLRIDGNDMDAQVTIWMKGVIAALEHEVGQCMMAQGWRVSLDHFPCAREHGGDDIKLPHPVIEVSSSKYFDAAGVEQLLPEGSYSLNRTRYQTTLTPAPGASWPITQARAGAVTIEVTCGYGSTPDKTPENIQLYILAKLVEQFDPGYKASAAQADFIDGLLDACRSNL